MLHFYLILFNKQNKEDFCNISRDDKRKKFIYIGYYIKVANLQYKQFYSI